MKHTQVVLIILYFVAVASQKHWIIFLSISEIFSRFIILKWKVQLGILQNIFPRFAHHILCWFRIWVDKSHKTWPGSPASDWSRSRVRCWWYWSTCIRVAPPPQCDRIFSFLQNEFGMVPDNALLTCEVNNKVFTAKSPCYFYWLFL